MLSLHLQTIPKIKLAKPEKEEPNLNFFERHPKKLLAAGGVLGAVALHQALKGKAPIPKTEAPTIIKTPSREDIEKAVKPLLRYGPRKPKKYRQMYVPHPDGPGEAAKVLEKYPHAKPIRKANEYSTHGEHERYNPEGVFPPKTVAASDHVMKQMGYVKKGKGTVKRASVSTFALWASLQ